MPIIVQPGMLMPITVPTVPSGSADNSIPVKFAVPTPIFVGVSILLSICIRIRIGSIVIKIYYTRYVVAFGQIEYFTCLLPLESTIEEVVPTYDVVETVIS